MLSFEVEAGWVVGECRLTFQPLEKNFADLVRNLQQASVTQEHTAEGGEQHAEVITRAESRGR